MTVTCPCKRRRSGSIIIKCAGGCEFDKWHTECAGFNNIVNKKQVEEIGEWICPCCIVKALHIPGYCPDNTVDHSYTIIEKVEQKLDDLKLGINDHINEQITKTLADIESKRKNETRLWSEVVGDGDSTEQSTFVTHVAKEVITQSARITCERENRENNVIIFNVQESASENTGERKKHDEDIVDQLCNHVVDEILSCEKVVRIGKKQQSNAASKDQNQKKPRLLKVCFKDSFDKRKFMSKLYKLKEAPVGLNGIRVQHDLAPDDRAMTKSLLAEAYQKNQTEKPDGFLYKVRGPPQAPRIVKIYKK